MSTSPAPVTPPAADWIKPGAPVVVIRVGGGASTINSETTVNAVAKQSFTVRGEDERFALDTQESKRLGGQWNSYSLLVVPVGSERHHQLLAARAVSDAKHAAHSAVDHWMTGRDDLARVEAVIATFTAYRDALAGGAR